MRKAVCWSILVLLAGVGAGRAQAPDMFPSYPGQPDQPAGLASEPLVSDLGDATSQGSRLLRADRFWIKGDYLLWGLEGERLPPLVTDQPVRHAPASRREGVGPAGNPDPVRR